MAMMVQAGSTAHFVVSYDNSISNGSDLANAVLVNCEQDLTELSALFGGILPAALTATPPQFIQVQIQMAGGSNPLGGGRNDFVSNITVFCSSGEYPAEVPPLVDCELAEIFMATQNPTPGVGFWPGWSNGEGLSRVMATVLYPCLRDLWAVGASWLNARTSPSMPDWVSNTEQTDQDAVSFGCACLFLDYLAFEKNFTWNQIIGAAAATLAGTASILGLANEPNGFFTLLANHFPVGTSVGLWADDDVYPFSAPSLYIRHNLCDDGTSHVGPLSNSPDIILKNNSVANPHSTFSTPSSINSDTESDPFVVEGQDNYLYLRVWNRGIDTANVTATVYWSPPATLVTPSMWSLIGSASIPDVPQAQFGFSQTNPPYLQAANVQVSNPGITWSQANIPAPGHYCFVATVGNAVEPAPTPGTFSSFQDYVNYILAHNNITWRNFNVGPIVGGVPIGERLGDFVALPFLLTGAWGEPQMFRFETIAQLPEGSRMAVQVPHWIGRGLKPAHTDVEEFEDAETDPKEPHRLRIYVEPSRLQSLGEIELPVATSAASHLLVQIPPKQRNRSHDVAIRQMYRGHEVGRITWRLLPDHTTIRNDYKHKTK